MTIELLRQSFWSQMDAALATVGECIRACPDSQWNAPVGNLTFSQVCFHTCFFADFYLARTEDLAAFKAQLFHRDHPDDFQDYEEVEDRQQRNAYSRQFIQAYLLYCRKKAREVIFGETLGTLAGETGFSWRKGSRGEHHIYNTRHIQHHAAQLSLRLRIDVEANIKWVGRGTELG